MRVLIVSQSYDPEPIVKPHGLATALRAAGHEVQVLTGFPNYPYGRVYPGYRRSLLKRELLAGVEVLRLGTIVDHSRSGLWRSASYGSYVLIASLIGTFLRRRPDLVWAYESPFHAAIPAVWLGMRFRAPVVLDVQDLWPETLAATGFSTSPRLHHIIGRITRWLHDRAAAIVVPSGGFKRNLVAKGAPAARVHVLHNWADDALAAAGNEPDANSTSAAPGAFKVVFAGNMGAAQGLGTVLEAAALLAGHAAIRFELIGDGLEYENLQARARQMGLANVSFLGRRPAAEMPALYARADALIVHLRDEPIFRLTIPSKVMAYLAAGKPVLCGIEGDAAATVLEAKAGMAFRPEDPLAMAEAILAMQALPAEERAKMGISGRNAFLSRFSQATVTRTYVSLLERVAADAGSARTPGVGA